MEGRRRRQRLLEAVVSTTYLLLTYLLLTYYLLEVVGDALHPLLPRLLRLACALLLAVADHRRTVLELRFRRRPRGVHCDG